MLRPAGSLVYALAGTLLAGATGCDDRTQVGPGGCATDDDCAGGQLCVDALCRAVCLDDGDCQPAESCAAGTCAIVNAVCAVDADCHTPGPCQTDFGSYCSGGTCHYEPFVCEQVAPLDPCKTLAGRCDATMAGSSCSGQACCVFDPVWPEGSGGAAPSCPLPGDDPNGDGVLDPGESWAGRCDHSGACAGCTNLAQCNDANPCSLDDCVSERCVYDVTSKLGLACTVVFAGDGECVVDGHGIACRMHPGQPCSTDQDCISAACECADDGCTTRLCHESGCALCQFDADGLGVCAQAGPGNAGEGCVAPGEACDAAGRCARVDGSACTADSDCAGGNCECADLSCATMLCSAAACACGFNQSGDAACDGALSDGTDDPEDCAGMTSGCYGGVCRRGPGEPCSVGGDCVSGYCADGVCCNTACSGNCDRCDVAGSAGTCTPDSSLCTGNCDTCDASGNCAPNDTACTGNCDYCAGSGTAWSCTGSNSYCAGACGYCAGSGTAFLCTCDLVYNLHSHVQCSAQGGALVSDGTNSFCRFSGGSCPGGWSQFQSWSATSAGAATYYNEVLTTDGGGCCTAGAVVCGAAAAATCSTSSHAWSNAAVESAGCAGTERVGRNSNGSCDNGSCGGSVACSGASSVSVSAVRTEIGCY